MDTMNPAAISRRTAVLGLAGLAIAGRSTEAAVNPATVPEPKRNTTVVNLWATWCPPCRREMPLPQQAQAAHPALNFVFVNQGEARDVILRYLQGQGIVLRNVLIDLRRATGVAFNERALPTTLFFDARGRLLSTRVGGLSEATLAERLGAIQDAVPEPMPGSASTDATPDPRPGQASPP